MKNPLSFIFESKLFPHARTLRTSLKQKFLDSMKVISGSVDDKDEITIGLFDIVTLGIPAALNGLTMQLTKRFDELSMEAELHAIPEWEFILLNSVQVLNFFLNKAPRFLFSGLIAVLAFLPITLPVYLIAKAIDYFRTDNLALALNAKDEFKETLQEKLLAKTDDEEDFDLEEVKATILNSNERKNIHFNISYFERKNQFICQLNRFVYDKNNYAIRAMFTHNIGDIANLYPEEAQEIVDSATTVPSF